MKKQYASITKKLSFTIDQLSNVIFEIKNANLVGIKSKIQLLLTGKTYRGSVKVIDKTFKRYKDYKAQPGENITMLQELNGKKCSIHLGKNKSRIFCNKNPILGKSGGGILPTSRRVFACAQNS